ncbi:hypothetical protein QM646_40170, partial [Rhodococcus erythropolis]|nr:hypothetical protein [Rhodococcus erythropolis]
PSFAVQRDLTLQARIIENLVGIFPANVDSATIAITSKLKTNTRVVNRALAAKKCAETSSAVDVE